MRAILRTCTVLNTHLEEKYCIFYSTTFILITSVTSYFADYMLHQSHIITITFLNVFISSKNVCCHENVIFLIS